MKRLIVLIYFALLFVTTAYPQGQWVWQHPQPQGHTLYAVHEFADGEILAAGTNGVLMRGNGNPQDWDIRNFAFGPEGYRIDLMQFVDEQNGWAINREYRKLYTTADRGVTWSPGTLPPVPINDLFRLNAQRVYLAAGSHVIGRSIDGGASWETFAVDTVGYYGGGGVFFLDENRGWAVGGGGALNDPQKGRIYSTLDGGLTWTLRFANTTRSTAMGQVFFVDENTGWAGGTDALIMHTADGGNSWTMQYQLPNTNFAILDLFFYDADNGIAVGTDGLVLTTTNGGQGWITRDSGTGVWIRDIYPLDAATILACGEFGLLMESTDRGQSWTHYSRNLTTAWLTCLAFSDEQTGWTGGGGKGVLIKTDNGGQSWAVADSGEHPIIAIQFLDPDNGFRIEWYGQTYRTRDGGASWELTDVLGRDGIYLDACFADTLNGWLVWDYLLDGYVKRTSDGGQTWQTQLSSPNISFRGIDFIDADNGWVCGEEGVIFRTANGGQSWTQQNTPVTETLFSIDFLDKDHGWSVGAWGTMIATQDGGQTWNEVAIPFTETIQDASILAQNTGWISGNASVGRTFDGGQTWETFEMPAPGYAFEAGYYSSMDKGWIVGSGGGIYHFDATTTAIPQYNGPAVLPTGIELAQNYPNPFNPETRVEYTLPEAGVAELQVFDVTGRLVHYQEQALPAGRHSMSWKGLSHAGVPVASGTYFYRLRFTSVDTRPGDPAAISATRKMLLLR